MQRVTKAIAVDTKIAVEDCFLGDDFDAVLGHSVPLDLATANLAKAPPPRHGNFQGGREVPTRSDKLEFDGAQGERLAARLDRPAGRARATALFAHCFTCGKDIAAASRIAGTLAANGFAVLRFDFTGLGHSEGEFGNTNFTSNVDDLVAAADYLRAHHEAPALLIGHSLGGAAILAAAGRVPECRAVATIGAPVDPEHVAHLFEGKRDEIEREGEAEVSMAGRPFRIKKQFLDDIKMHDQRKRIADLRRPLLIFHAPRDELVGIDNAGEIFAAAKHPKSFVSLDAADHLLTRKPDAAYVADVLSAWATRYVGAVEERAFGAPAGTVIVAETGEGGYANEIAAGPHYLRADEPASVGGLDTGPGPYDLLLAALGACTSMTLRMYADRKKWALDKVTVTLRHDKIHAADCADCETREGRIDHIERELTVDGNLSAEERSRLLEIADKCPVHRTLKSEIKIDTRWVASG
ncbi:MAG: alpha/beta fold hydrolase [Alphaproteobacteria bacterium]|nr:alpha/beta fold hydrolase [Alphaproteobacteria bacterium]